VTTGEEKCVTRAEKRGKASQCTADGKWLLAMECSQYTGCPAGQKCCVQEPVPGFLQSVCATSCQHEEACTVNGACKDPGFACSNAPNSRSGGRCVHKAQPPFKVPQPKSGCPGHYMPSINDDDCHLICSKPADCGAGHTCMNDHMGGQTYCM
jgi:hypothetical protein